MKITSLGLLAWLAVGCGSSQTVTISGKAAPESKLVYAPKLPPANAASIGIMSSPKAGSQTIPIRDVEVFEFTAAIDDDASGEQLYWACDGDVIYVWGTIEIEQVGLAQFILEADDFGYGWMVVTRDSTLSGCSADLNSELA